MKFGSNLTNPFLQVAMSASEATIWHACEAKEGLEICAEMGQFADGRDLVKVTLFSGDRMASFSMLLRKYFDRGALWRVARRAWEVRGAREGQRRPLHFSPGRCAAAMN
jgi:hypothetical protein